MIKIYGIKTCDSVRKAIKYMKNHKLDYELVDFKVSPVDEQKISSWLDKVSINTLFNTRGTTYRTLKLKEMNLTDSQKQTWLSKENMLIKRPVIEYHGSIIIAFNENTYDEIFKG